MKIMMITLDSPASILNNNEDLIINANFFSENGHEVFLISGPGEKIDNDKFCHIPSNSNFEMKNVNKLLKILNNSCNFFINLTKKIKDISPDVIVAVGSASVYLNFLLGIFFSKFFDIPLIAEWRGSDLLLKNSRWRIFIKKLILDKSTINIVRSKEMFNKASKLVPNTNIKILPGKGVDINKFKPDHSLKENKNKKIKILFVGRLHQIKGLNYLIKAFSYLNQKYASSRLIIVGDGEIKDDLIVLARKKGCLDDVEFVGEVNHDRLHKYYQKSDIFVLPSLSEGLSNVLMEAMACGLPVVTTNVGGNPELIKDKKGGFLVKPKEVNEISKAIQELIEKPKLRKDMGKFNREYVKQYDQKNILKNKLEVLEKIVES